MTSRRSLNSSFNTSGSSGKRVYVIAYEGYHVDAGGVLSEEERKALDKAYEVLSASGASVGKTSIQKILNLKKNSPGISYIVPRFDGVVFDKLQSLEARIYGPLAITTSLESVNQKIYLWDYPLLCTSFKGLLITCTGLTADERKTLDIMIKHMGGVFSGNMSDTTTHLIAMECNPVSEKYTLARKFKLPVVKSDWINTIYQDALRGEQRDAKSMAELFLVPLFTNCVTTCSGVSHDERLKISKLVTQHGGSFSGEMNRESCTHLLTNSLTGVKFKKAKEWGTVNIVVVRWLSSCLAKGYRLPESKFFPGNKTSTQNDRTNATLGGSGLSVSTIHPVNSSITSVASSVVRRPSSKTNLVSSVINPLKVSSFRRQTSVLAPPKAADPVLDADLSELKDDYGQYLLDCRVHFFEVPDKDLRIYTFLANSTGCTIVADTNLEDDDCRRRGSFPTHIIVPSNANLNYNKIKILKKAMDYDIDVVRGEWLLDCVRDKSLLDGSNLKYVHPSVKIDFTENQPITKVTRPSVAGAFTLTMSETRIKRRSTGFGIDTTKGSSLMNSTEDLRFGMPGEYDSSCSSRGISKQESLVRQVESGPSSSKDHPNATSTQRNSFHSPVDYHNVSAMQPVHSDPDPIDSFDTSYVMQQMKTPACKSPPGTVKLSPLRKSILKNTENGQAKETSFEAIPSSFRPQQMHQVTQFQDSNARMPPLSPTPLKLPSTSRQTFSTFNGDPKSSTAKIFTTIPSQSSQPETQPFFQNKTFAVDMLPTDSQQNIVVSEIQRLGGQVVPIINLIEPIEVDYLVTPSLDFEIHKYADVYYQNLATVFWMQYCSDSSKECPINDHPLFKPFGFIRDRTILKGVVAAVSGSNMRVEKTIFGSLVDEMGGILQPAMSRIVTSKLLRTTHVIALGPSSRLKDIREWENIHIVDGSWLIECIAKGRRLPEENYPFNEVLFKHYSGRSDPIWMQSSKQRHRSRTVLEETGDILPETMVLPRSIFVPNREEEEDNGPIESLFTHKSKSSSPLVTSNSTEANQLNLSAPMEDYISGKRQYRLKIFENQTTPKVAKCNVNIAKVFDYDDTESNASTLGTLPEDSTSGESFIANQMKKMVRNCCNDTAEFNRFYENLNSKKDNRDWHDVTIYKKAAYETGPREIVEPAKLTSPGLYLRPFPTGPKTPTHLAQSAPIIFDLTEDNVLDFEHSEAQKPNENINAPTASAASPFAEPTRLDEVKPVESETVKAAEKDQEPTHTPPPVSVEATTTPTEQPTSSIVIQASTPVGITSQQSERPVLSTLPAMNPADVSGQSDQHPVNTENVPISSMISLNVPGTAQPPTRVDSTSNLPTSKPTNIPGSSTRLKTRPFNIFESETYQARISHTSRILDELSKKVRESNDMQQQPESSDSDEEDPFIASAKQCNEMAKRTDFKEDIKTGKPLGPQPDFPVTMGWAKGCSTQELLPADPNRIFEDVDENHYGGFDSNEMRPITLKFKPPTTTSLEELIRPKKKKKGSDVEIDKAKQWLLDGEREWLEKQAAKKAAEETEAAVKKAAEKATTTSGTSVNAEKTDATSNNSVLEVVPPVEITENSKVVQGQVCDPIVVKLPETVSKIASSKTPTKTVNSDDLDSFNISYDFENLDTQPNVLPRAVAQLKDLHFLDSDTTTSLQSDIVLSALKVPSNPTSFENTEPTKKLPSLAVVQEEHSFNLENNAWKITHPLPPPLGSTENIVRNSEALPGSQCSQRRRPIAEILKNEKSLSPKAKRQKEGLIPGESVASTAAPSKKELAIPVPTKMTTRRESKTLRLSLMSKPSTADESLTSLEVSNVFVHKRFMLSGVNTDERQNIMQQIRMLSGTILEQPGEFPIAQVILCSKPARTQKLLSAIAAGKVICHTSYVIASARKGEWLDEEEYEFGNPKSYRHIRIQDLSALAKQVAEAGFRWRKQIELSGHGAFYGWKVIMFMDQNRAEALSEVIKCGGGEAQLSTCVANSRILGTFTHVIIKGLHPSREQLTILGKENVPFYTDNLLSDYLIGAVPEKALTKHHPCHLEFH